MSLSANCDLTLLADAVRTATTISADQDNSNGRGVLVYLNVTAASGTGGLQVLIQGKDPASGVYRGLIGTPTAITATGNYAYLLYPGASGGPTSSTVSNPLPRTWRVQVIHGDSSNYEYSVAASVIV